MSKKSLVFLALASVFPLVASAEGPSLPPAQPIEDSGAVSWAASDVLKVQESALDVKAAPVTYTVPGDFPTIQAAVDAAAPGDTIEVTGSHAGQVLVTKSISLIGIGSGATIAATDAMPVALVQGATSFRPVVFVGGTSGVVIQNLLIDGLGKGNTNNSFVGLLVHDAEVSVSSSTVTGIVNSPLDGSQHGVGIRSSGASVLQLQDVDINNFQKNGTAFTPATHVVWNGGTVTGAGPTAVTAQNGVQFGSGSGGVTGSITGVTMRNIDYTGATWTASALLIYFSDGLQVTNCVVEDSQAGLYTYEAENLVFTDNVFDQNQFNLVYGGSATFIGNTFSNSDDAGGYGIGLWLYDVLGATGTGNTFEDNPYGLYVAGTSTGVSFPDSRFVYNVESCVNETTETVNITHSWWGDPAGPGTCPTGFDCADWQTHDGPLPVPAASTFGLMGLVLALVAGGLFYISRTAGKSYL
ncbi:MAG: NosD protein [Patescibacteria group bacterium]|nr:NosD protein [Patescibacteria group bacterium]